jgi:hydrogenase-4 component B
VLGLIGAFGAALWGLTQRHPKAVLAYSTVSQMGLLLALMGAGQAVAFYALHHGLAKGTLFLLVGVLAAAATPRRRRATLALAGLVALSVAGLPFTGGALAKAAAKHGLGPAVSLAFTVSGVTTTLVLAWFLHRLAGNPWSSAASRWPALLAGAAALGGAALLAPWAVWSGDIEGPLTDALSLHTALQLLWPVIVGLALAALLVRRPLPEQPPGDLFNLSPRRAVPPSPDRRRPAIWRRLLRLLLRTRRAEIAMRRWPAAGGLLVAGVLVMALLLTDL